MLWEKEPRMNESKENMMKIKSLIINTFPLTTGIGEYVSDLLNLKNSACISLIFKKWAGLKYNYPGINYYSFVPELNDKIEFLLNAYFQKITFHRLSKLVKENKADIIHYADPSVTPLNINCVQTVTIHDLLSYFPDKTDGGLFNGRYRYVVKNLDLYKKFSNVISISNKVKNELIEMGWNNEISVIPYPISNSFRFLDKKRFAREQLGLPINKHLILSVSTNAPRKNLPTVRKIMETFDDDFILIRVGPKLGRSITFNYIDDREKMNLIYNACDVLLFPTLDEGFGRPVVEAMSAGLPCVLSDIEIMHELAGNAAMFVSNNDIESYRESILYSIENANILRSYGLERAKNFTFNVFFQNMLRFYSKIT